MGLYVLLLSSPSPSSAPSSGCQASEDTLPPSLGVNSRLCTQLSRASGRAGHVCVAVGKDVGLLILRPAWVC